MPKHSLLPISLKPCIYLFYCFLAISPLLSKAQQQVTWTDLFGVNIEADNTLKKTAPYGSDNGGAASVEILPAGVDGWVEVTVMENDKTRYLGLSDVNSGINPSTIDYSLQFGNHDHHVNTFENGVRIGYAGFTANYGQGEVFRIERVGTTIYYKRNGNTFYTSTVTSTTALRVAVCLVDIGATIHDAKVSFGEKPIDEGEVPDHLEYQALYDLYYCTDGDNWGEFGEDWLNGSTNEHFSLWPGVLVENGDVTGLFLDFPDLNGTLCSSIGNLKKLKVLDISFSRINNIAPEFSNLESLEVINLAGVTSGTYNILERILLTPSIKEISMDWGNNSSSQLTPDISSMINLAILNISNIGLTGEIPFEIGNCKKLQQLNISFNAVSGSIPSSIGALTGLTSLHMERNNLEGSIPSEIGNLSLVEAINISGNNLSGALPASIGNLSNLRSLNLNDNFLSSELPSTIGNLPNLAFLDLGHNRFTGGILKSLASLPNIKHISLNDNLFDEEIPDAFNMIRLHHLNIENNNFSGKIYGSIFYSSTPFLVQVCSNVY